MWKVDLAGMKKGLDRGMEFVKKEFLTKDAAECVENRPGQTAIVYSVKEAPKEIGDFNEISDQGNVFLVPIDHPTVAEVLHLFPLPNREDFVFRFKVPDPQFGFVWQDVPRDSTLPVPLWNGSAFMEAILVHAAAKANIAKVNPTPTRLNREDLVEARRKAEAAQVQAARDFAQANAQSDADRRQNKLQVQSNIGAELDAWAFAEGNKLKDVRTLLSTAGSVLWPSSGWTDVAIGDLMMNEAAVKKHYRKAILLCHPDRHQQASAEQQYRADRVFNAINESYKVFR